MEYLNSSEYPSAYAINLLLAEEQGISLPELSEPPSYEQAVRLMLRALSIGLGPFILVINNIPIEEWNLSAVDGDQEKFAKDVALVRSIVGLVPVLNQAQMEQYKQKGREKEMQTDRAMEFFRASVSWYVGQTIKSS